MSIQIKNNMLVLQTHSNGVHPTLIKNILNKVYNFYKENNLYNEFNQYESYFVKPFNLIFMPNDKPSLSFELDFYLGRTSHSSKIITLTFFDNEICLYMENLNLNGLTNIDINNIKEHLTVKTPTLMAKYLSELIELIHSAK